MKGLLARALLWTTLESVCVTLVAFSTLFVYAMFLTPAELGRGALVVSVVQLLTVPTETVFQSALVQRHTYEAIDYRTALTACLAIAAAFLALSFPFGGLFAGAVGDDEVVSLLPAAACSLIFSALSVPIVARHRRDLHFRPLTVRTVVARVVAALGGISAAVLGAGAWTLVVQQLVYAVLSYLLLQLQAREIIAPGFSRSSFLQLSRLGSFPAASYLLTIAAPKLFVIVIASAFGTTAAGFANLAFRAIDTARDVISAAVGQLLLPLLSKVKRETGREEEVTLMGTSLVCATTFPIFWGGAICAPELINVLFGPEWQASVPLFGAHSLTMSYHFGLVVVVALMTAIGTPGGMLPGLVAQLVVVMGAAFFGGRAGAEDASWVMAAIWMLRVFVSMPFDFIFIRRKLGDRFGSFARRLLRYVAHSLAMAVAITIVDLFVGPHITEPERLGLKVVVGFVAITILYILFERPILRQLQQLLYLGIGIRKEA